MVIELRTPSRRAAHSLAAVALSSILQCACSGNPVADATADVADALDAHDSVADTSEADDGLVDITETSFDVRDASDGDAPDANDADSGARRACGVSDLGTGVIDIASAPYGVLPGAITEPMATTLARTRAIQQAIDDSMTQQQVVYFPPGLYPVTLDPTESLAMNAALHCRQSVSGDAPTHALDGRFHPCVLLGSTCDPANPPTLRLVSAAAGTTLLDIYAYGVSAAGCNSPVFPCRKFNESYNNIVRNLVLSVGVVGDATALNMRGAQGDSIYDTTIDLTEATGGTGLVGGPGSGGIVANLTIRGGDVGLDYHPSGEQGTVAAVTLVGQHVNAIELQPSTSFVGAGIDIQEFHGQVAVDITPSATQGPSGAATLVDTSIAFASDAPVGNRVAVDATRSVYLENLFVTAGNIVLRTPGPDPASVTIPSALSAGTVHVEVSAGQPFGAIDVVPAPSDPAFRAPSHDWVEGDSTCDPCTEDVLIAPAAATLPAGLFGSGGLHGWTSLPSIDDPSAMLATPADDLQSDVEAARGRPLILTAGTYYLPDTLHLHSDSIIVGLAPTVARLMPDGTLFTTPQRFIVDTDDDATGQTVFAFVGMYADGDYDPRVGGAAVSGLNWQSGPQSLVVTPFPNPLDVTHTAIEILPIQNAWYEISGGGRFYAAWGVQNSAPRGANFSIYHITGTVGSRFYPFDIEHAFGHVNARVDDASDVRFYGLKAECDDGDDVLVMHDVTDVRMYGHGGDGSTSTAGTALYVIYGTNSDVRLANVVDALDHYDGVTTDDPRTYGVLLFGDTASSLSNPLASVVAERPALFMIP